MLLLIAVAVLATASASVTAVASRMSRRSAEAELLAIGGEFRRALASYRAASIQGPFGGPRELSELVEDVRGAQPRRHLRKVYFDPMTGGQDWGLVRGPDGTIVGVYSLAQGEPIKRTGFDAGLVGFEDAKSYSYWVFAIGVPHELGKR